MEHVGCNLISDYRDYYDHELGSTPLSHQLSFVRMKKDALTWQQQWDLLHSFNVEMPPHGTLSTLKAQALQRHGRQPVDPHELIFAAIRNNRIEAHSWHSSEQLPADTVAMQLDLKQVKEVFRYVQIGNLNAWFYYKNSSQHGFDVASPPAVISLGGPLPAYTLCQFKDALFSVDLVRQGTRLVAISYSRTPHLGEAGLELHLTAADVAHAIMDRLDDAPLYEGEADDS